VVLIFVQIPECVDQRGLYLGKVENRVMIVRLRRGEAERSSLGFLPINGHNNVPSGEAPDEVRPISTI
jgi:hypothetical protein